MVSYSNFCFIPLIAVEQYQEFNQADISHRLLSPKDETSNLEVDPLSNTAARCYTVLASIAMKNIREIHCSISEINEKTLKIGYLMPCYTLDYLF